MNIVRDSAEGQAFVGQFGGIFEHSPWVAEEALEWLPDGPPTAATVHAAMVQAFRAASTEKRLQVLRAHPDLAGRLAIAGGLTADSKAEQASAGLDRLTPDEHALFTTCNAIYTDKFGFPFIIAVRGKTKDDILAAFQARLDNTPDEEFATATAEVETIARLRLDALFPGTAA
ncbi:2-oxo-4-hydroxy-4-carboxy-5-ureidoimidazoline decarboxylase [Rhizobium sp. DKSPLA3]|uniref:2-oxo-4-hydroxy-4-carboxy-5-ureidoimidazoline decarboxylase n=1 Tax=Rhizobium quercicola TaxID=2901226 RepID=A0A9X1NRP6_9HYPH|nr:2-oxo-4-hydroxy-4-carboxy-5-ureidoimidazoline decarboxylase [Rhizobium quercicola]MCD7109100.1 2-oxo-4-hydroxy-4-carboxy-5-ureidoimidazoline decarboxylase [Rhizobium quercicola]